MRLSTFLVADHAEAVGGKLYVTGGCWNSITVLQLPATHPHLTVAAALHIPWRATNQPHSLHLDLVDEDEQSRLPEPLQGKLEAGRPPGMRAGDEAIVVLTFNFDGLKLERAGIHSFVLSVDGTELSRIGFKVLVAGRSALPDAPREADTLD
ncbi:MAG TPA: hypothetical protein VG276_29935 [Actinomycetes bacterium]|jgi:hypothetical protein|nr:hypothetical protein [Actinomycetes bacterium]